MRARAVDDFEDAFRQMLPRAFRVAHRILGDDTLAEDAAAETLARAHASWRRVGALPYRDSWVLRVAANVAIDMIRKDRRVVARADPWVGVTAPCENERDTVALRVALVAALAALSRRQREIVVLHYLEEFTETEIARCLHVSVGTVKKATSRAKETLRRELGDDWHQVALAPA